MIDFGSFRRVDHKSKPTDPREIFKRRPSGEGAANDLWRGQAEALGKWFEESKRETLIALNTGAGKTIIGLLIAQSYVNQGLPNVLYACSTIDLVHQTAAEAKRLGLDVTCRFTGKFDNDLFEQGRAFCITTYPTIHNPLTVFRGQLRPSAIIFDDAHVANRIIRESFTLQIPKQTKQELFNELVELMRPSFAEAGLRTRFEAALASSVGGVVLLVPPTGFFDLSDKITSLLQSRISDKDAQAYFPWLLLRDHIKRCACFIRHDLIEITPPFVPTLTLPAFAADVRHVYLSATLTAEAEFTRVFGRKPEITIAPDVDAGDGERLFLFASKFEGGQISREQVQSLSEENKVLIAVPGRSLAKKWDFAVSPTREEFTERLNSFRRASRGAFLLPGRFDGIDLPGSQCRIMVVDGLPTGTNLLEQYLFGSLRMDHLQAQTVSLRLTQLVGRIIRGRQDFGVFLIADKRVENWLKNERNRSFMPELLRRQLFLGEAIESQIVGPIGPATCREMVGKVLERDRDWVDFYRDHISENDVSNARLNENTSEDAVLSEAGRREVRFISRLWDNDSTAKDELEDILKDVAIHDPMLAGWYSLWIGMSYYSDGMTDAAIDFFDEARRRTSYGLPVPRRRFADVAVDRPPKTFFEDALRQLCEGNVVRINDRIAKLRVTTRDAFRNDASHRQCEEGLRAVGAALGFLSSRPCNENGVGPDNLWIDVQAKQMIAFELKTDKGVDSIINKEDVGQGLNHLEWLKRQYPDLKLPGLIFLTDCRVVSERASPSEQLHFGSQERLRSVWDEVIEILERIRPRTADSDESGHRFRLKAASDSDRLRTAFRRLRTAPRSTGCKGSRGRTGVKS